MAFDSHPRTLGFRAVAYERFDSDVVVADFTPKMTSCSYSTRVHGGCHQAQMSLRLPVTQAVRYVNQEIPLFFSPPRHHRGFGMALGGQDNSRHHRRAAWVYPPKPERFGLLGQRKG